MESSTVFVYQENDDTQAYTMLGDVEVGDSFIFNGNKFTKTSDLGWVLGFMNVIDDRNEPCHLHPSVKVSLVQ